MVKEKHPGCGTTEQDADPAGRFDYKSEKRRALIHERRIRKRETPAEIAAVRAALDEGEKSGVSMRTPKEIMDAVIARKRENGELQIEASDRQRF